MLRIIATSDIRPTGKNSVSGRPVDRARLLQGTSECTHADTGLPRIISRLRARHSNCAPSLRATARLGSLPSATTISMRWKPSALLQEIARSGSQLRDAKAKTL
jgi:hypothetical protein